MQNYILYTTKGNNRLTKSNPTKSTLFAEDWADAMEEFRKQALSWNEAEFFNITEDDFRGDLNTDTYSVQIDNTTYHIFK